MYRRDGNCLLGTATVCFLMLVNQACPHHDVWITTFVVSGTLFVGPACPRRAERRDWLIVVSAE